MESLEKEATVLGKLTFSKDDFENLKKKDEKLAKAMEILPFYTRETDEDLFRSLINNIVGQQISMKAQETVWKRFLDYFPAITPEHIAAATLEEIQGLGISFRKAGYLKGTAEMVLKNEISLKDLYSLSDEEVIKELVKLPGIGPWTAEMLLIFTMGRKDVLSYGDLAIRKGLMMLYGHETITKEIFETYRQRFSPYGTLASLYLWEISSGNYTLPE